MRNTTDTTNKIIETIQMALKGHLDPSSNFNPMFLAEAIETKIGFSNTFKERNTMNVNDAMNRFNEAIDDICIDMDNELEQLDKDEVLLKNFINGQKTACEKLRESLKTKF